MNDLLTTKETAKELKVSVRRIQALIGAGRLPAKKIGRDWIIHKADLDLVRVRKPGRPPRK